MEVARPLAPHNLSMNRNVELDVSEALREKAKGNLGLYRLMVQDITNGARLTAWLTMLTKSVTDIADTHYELLDALLSFDWFTRVPTEVAAYTEFLKHLTFAKPNFFEKIYKSMVNCFRGPPKTSAALMDEKTELSDIDRDTSLDAIHATLKTLLHAHPTSASVLRNVVCDRFPHKVFLTAVQASYVKQVLHMTTYIPSLRKDVLELIIDRIVQIDVELKSEMRRPAVNELNQSEEMFHFEADTTTATPIKTVEMDENEEKVDMMLFTLLKWMSSLSELGPEDLERREMLGDVFTVLLGVYDRLLLTTTHTKYAQWPLFYICSLQEEFTMRLFDHLFNIVQNEKYPPQQRQRACMYIASHTSRATYVPESMTQQVLNYMCNWMSMYIDLQGDTAAPDASTHVLFYALFHGVAYILRLQHHTLFDRPAAKHTIQELHIPKIVNSALNPLKVCSSALVGPFVDVMSQYGVLFTNTLLQNERLVLPARDMFGPLSLLTDFFPFDPYLLRQSSAFLLPFYHFPEQSGKLNIRTNTFESGYATEGETELDMYLRPDHSEHDEMDEDDAHTTESMLAMMDFGRGSVQTKTPKKPDANEGVFGSFDDKSSISSGQGSSFSQASGNFNPPQQGFGMAFGVACASPATNGSFMSASPLRGPSPATDPGFLVGSLEPRRSSSKRARDDNWAPSTPLSAAIFTPTASKAPNPFSVSISPSTTASAWGAPIVSTSTPSEH